MAMSNRIRRELGKQRELLWFLLFGKKCCFCKLDLLSAEERGTLKNHVRFGNATAPPLDLDITEHHIDGDHDNNVPSNIALCHDTCHKRHHANLVFAQVNGVKPKVMRPVDYLRAA